MQPISYRFIQYLLAWVLAVLIAMTLINAFTLEVFFVTSLIGILAITEVMLPINIRPLWYRRLRWVIVVGLGVFGYILLRRVFSLLPIEFTLGL